MVHFKVSHTIWKVQLDGKFSLHFAYVAQGYWITQILAANIALNTHFYPSLCLKVKHGIFLH